MHVEVVAKLDGARLSGWNVDLPAKHPVVARQPIAGGGPVIEMHLDLLHLGDRDAVGDLELQRA